MAVLDVYTFLRLRSLHHATKMLDEMSFPAAFSRAREGIKAAHARRG